MKVAINTCYGGFNLSPRAMKRMSELNGRECYFFVPARNGNGTDFHTHIPITVEELESKRHFIFFAYDIPDVSSLPDQKEWHSMSLEERGESNRIWSEHSIESRYRDAERCDPKLIQVIEELGDKASGDCAKLVIVEIPDGTEYEIQEYDGMESIHEVHRSW